MHSLAQLHHTIQLARCRGLDSPLFPAVTPLAMGDEADDADEGVGRAGDDCRLASVVSREGCGGRRETRQEEWASDADSCKGCC